MPVSETAASAERIAAPVNPAPASASAPNQSYFGSFLTGCGQVMGYFRGRSSELTPTYDLRGPAARQEINFSDAAQTTHDLCGLVTRLKQTIAEAPVTEAQRQELDRAIKVVKYEHQSLTLLENYELTPQDQSALEEANKLSYREAADAQKIAQLLEKERPFALFALKFDKKQTPSLKKIHVFFQRAIDALGNPKQPMSPQDMDALMSRLHHCEALDALQREPLITAIAKFAKLQPDYLPRILSFCVSDVELKALNTRIQLLSELKKRCNFGVQNCLSTPGETSQTLLGQLVNNRNLTSNLLPLFPSILRKNPEAFKAFWQHTNQYDLTNHLHAWVRQLLSNNEVSRLGRGNNDLHNFVKMCINQKTSCHLFAALLTSTGPNALTASEKSALETALADTFLAGHNTPAKRLQKKCEPGQQLENRKILVNPLFLEHCISHPKRENCGGNVAPLVILERLTQSATLAAQTNPERYADDFLALQSSLRRLINTFDLHPNSDIGVEFLDTVISNLANKLSEPGNFEDKLQFSQNFLKAMSAVEFQDIDGSRQGNFLQTLTLVKNALAGNFETLAQSSEGLDDTLLRELCRYRFDRNTFDDWFTQGNPSLPEALQSKILSNMGQIDGFIQPYQTVLSEAGYHYLNHNQVAVLSAVQQLAEHENLFLKLGTGQGKTLVSALSAIAMLTSKNPPERVFVFSSYDHLSARDHAKMKFLFEAAGIRSAYIKDVNDLNRMPVQVQVIFSDTEHFKEAVEHAFVHSADEGKPLPDAVSTLLDPSKAAVVLDEGDLTTIDDRNTITVYNHHTLFDITNKEALHQSFNDFKNILLPEDTDYFEALDTNLDAKCQAWYTSEMSEDQLAQTGECKTDPASGKVYHSAASFGAVLTQKGSYQAPALAFNFVHFVRRCQKAICLSGSIGQQHMPAFDALFANGHQNRFIDIPNFYGNHNQAFLNKERTKQTNLDNAAWRKAILNDIVDAYQKDQPILVFLDESNAKQVEDWQKLIEEDGRCAGFKLNKIIKESDVSSGDAVRQACQPKTITLATQICGRGVDFLMPRDHPLGMHVLVTALPPNNNDRLLTQMIGRTARLGKRGTHSIIVQDDWQAFDNKSRRKNGSPIMADPLRIRRDKQFELSRYFVSRLRQIQNGIGDLLNEPKKVSRRWTLLTHLINNHAVRLSTDEEFEKCKKFIDHKVLG